MSQHRARRSAGGVGEHAGGVVAPAPARALARAPASAPPSSSSSSWTPECSVDAWMKDRMSRVHIDFQALRDAVVPAGRSLPDEMVLLAGELMKNIAKGVATEVEVLETQSRWGVERTVIDEQVRDAKERAVQHLQTLERRLLDATHAQQRKDHLASLVDQVILAHRQEPDAEFDKLWSNVSRAHPFPERPEHPPADLVAGVRIYLDDYRKDFAHDDEVLVARDDDHIPNDPYSLQPVNEPCTLTPCGHVYDRPTLVDYLRTARGAQRCAHAGCRSVLSLDRVRDAPQLKRQYERIRMISESQALASQVGAAAAHAHVNVSTNIAVKRQREDDDEAEEEDGQEEEVLDEDDDDDGGERSTRQ